MWAALTALAALLGALGLGLPATQPGSGLPPIGLPTTPPSASAPQPIGTLDAGHPLLGFSGAIQNPTPLPLVNVPVPVVCAAQCKEFEFQAATTTPFLVAIKNTVTAQGGTFNADDGFDLYLYGPDNRLVDAKNGIGADGQALSVSTPAAGTYTIVVTFTYAEDANASYVGEVRLEQGTTWTPAPCSTTTIGSVTGCFYLPQLQAVPAYDLAVTGLPPVASTPLGFPLPVSVPTSNSCYLDESVGLDSPSLGGIEHPITRCLRFTSDIQDAGSGPLEVEIPWLTSSGTSGFVPGECQAQQVLFDSSGDAATRPAGACEFHPEHAHFHYKNLVSFTLYDAGSYSVSTGGTLGPVVGSSLKESFCLSDDDYFGYGTSGPNGPRSFVGQPGCNAPSQIGTSGAQVTEGISPGWGDVYTWDTPDQFIDISSVAPGDYALVEETNPDGALLVAGTSQQTCSITTLTLTATSVTQTGTQQNVACPA